MNHFSQFCQKLSPIEKGEGGTNTDNTSARLLVDPEMIGIFFKELDRYIWKKHFVIL